MTITLVNDRMQVQQGAKASVQPTTPPAAMRDGREWGAAVCRTVPRWPVKEDTGNVLLQLDRGVGAVEFLVDRGAALDRGVACPGLARGLVLALSIRPARWVFLTTPDDPGAAASRVAMVGTRLRMTAPDALALPLSVTAHGPARWIVSPGVVAYTPPRLQSVLSAAWQMVAG